MSLLNYSSTYKPFNYPFAMELATSHEEMVWLESEADLSEDISDWKTKLSKSEKDFITNILRLFTQGDVQVGQNYHEFLIPKFKNNEIRVMLTTFANREGTHQRAYSLLNETLGLPDEEYHKFLEYSEMSDKIEFMQSSDISTHTGLALALAKSVFNEGVSLFASFAMLLNFQRFGKMKGMNKIVEWSIKDESVHVEGNSWLFTQFCKEHPRIVTDELKSKIYSIANDVISLEGKFIDLSFSNFEIQGQTKEEIKDYIRFITDRRLMQLGLKPISNVEKNPLPWLDWVVSGVDHTNFFEARVTEYNVNGMTGEWEW